MTNHEPTTEERNETAIKHSLMHSGASENLAGAIADAAARGGLNRMQVSYDSWDEFDDVRGKVFVSVKGAVPEPLHDRLTDMGFEVMDNYDAHSDDGPHGCKYADTK